MVAFEKNLGDHTAKLPLGECQVLGKEGLDICFLLGSFDGFGHTLQDGIHAALGSVLGIHSGGDIALGEIALIVFFQ